MLEITATDDGNLRNSAIHSPSNATLMTDAPLECHAHTCPVFQSQHPAIEKTVQVHRGI